MKPVVALVGLAVLFFSPPSLAALTEAAIQPGGPLGDPPFCTLNFVFKDAVNTYIGTAGHCVSEGERVGNAEAGEFGTVVRSDDEFPDFALIQIDADKVDLVSPAVRVWGGPTAAATMDSALVADPLLLHGYGIGFSTTPATRPRAGVLISYTATDYRAETGAVFGDSGGPILDAQDGRAVGIVSHFDLTDVPPATDEGPTVETILAGLRGIGYDLTLQSAPFPV